MRRLAPICVAAAAAALFPAAGGAATFDGIVVAKQGHTVLAAGPDGVVHAVAGGAPLGARISVTRSGLRVTGRTRDALVRGVVVRRTGSSVYLAAGRHVIAVRMRRTLATVGAGGVEPGAVVVAHVRIADTGDLTEEQLDVSP